MSNRQSFVEQPGAASSALAVRQACRSGSLAAHTSGLASAHVQGNLVILPKAYAADFLRFCQANPKPCPLLGVSEAGDPALPALGEDIDIRTDLPRYRVWRNGELVDEPTDVRYIATLRPCSTWRSTMPSAISACSKVKEQPMTKLTMSSLHSARTSVGSSTSSPFRHTR